MPSRQHLLHFTTTRTCPAVARGLSEADPDTGTARLEALLAVEWGALLAAGFINGCGPKGFGGLVPDFSPEMEAAGNLHDIRYLIGGTDVEEHTANFLFARHAPTLYSAAVNAAGDRWFTRREAPLTHCELLVILQAAYLVVDYADAIACSPSVKTMAAMDRQIREALTLTIT